MEIKEAVEIAAKMVDPKDEVFGRVLFVPGRVIGMSERGFVEIAVDHDIDAAVAPKMLSRAMGSVTDPVLSMSKNRLVVKGDEGRFEIPVTETKDAPSVPSHPDKWHTPPAGWNPNVVSWACLTAGEQSRGHMRGVCWRPEYIASTDGCRGSMVWIGECDIDLPTAGALFYWDGAIDAEQVGLTDRYIHVRSGDVVVSSRLIEKTFPPLERVVPRDIKYTGSCSTKELLSMISRSSTVDNGTVEMSFDGDDLVFYAESDFGEFRGAIPFTHETTPPAGKISARMTLLSPAIKLSKDESVDVMFPMAPGGGIDPLYINFGRGIAVLMPMKK